jgi:hypothetical protein
VSSFPLDGLVYIFGRRNRDKMKMVLAAVEQFQIFRTVVSYLILLHSGDYAT